MANQKLIVIQTSTATYEKNNNKALEALIEADGEWDALLVERDLPVMDGFGIASALRDFEKARRNRASSIRAVAVEGREKVDIRTRGHGIERDPEGEIVNEH